MWAESQLWVESTVDFPHKGTVMGKAFQRHAHASPVSIDKVSNKGHVIRTPGYFIVYKYSTFNLDNDIIDFIHLSLSFTSPMTILSVCSFQLKPVRARDAGRSDCLLNTIKTTAEGNESSIDPSLLQNCALWDLSNALWDLCNSSIAGPPQPTHREGTLENASMLLKTTEHHVTWQILDYSVLVLVTYHRRSLYFAQIFYTCDSATDIFRLHQIFPLVWGDQCWDRVDYFVYSDIFIHMWTINSRINLSYVTHSIGRTTHCAPQQRYQCVRWLCERKQSALGLAALSVTSHRRFRSLRAQP